jgi:hypothetical protein
MGLILGVGVSNVSQMQIVKQQTLKCEPAMSKRALCIKYN